VGPVGRPADNARRSVDIGAQLWRRRLVGFGRVFTIPKDSQGSSDAYLDLVQDVLLGRFTPDDLLKPIRRPTRLVSRMVFDLLASRGLHVGGSASEDVQGVENGVVWPQNAMTMVGRRRLGNLRDCIEDVVKNDVAGDIIETGVWRGGASIFGRAVLRSLGVPDRRVWLADSFAGLPVADTERFPGDHDAFPFHAVDVLAVPLEDVRANFERFRLLDDQVCFLRGWFKDTLPGLTNERWAVLRLDGDLYESTIQALESLYPNLSVGGYVIVDDYLVVPNCKRAVDDYRSQHGIVDPLQDIDGSGVFWRRRPAPAAPTAHAAGTS
jgi:O-methyltransferase